MATIKTSTFVARVALLGTTAATALLIASAVKAQQTCDVMGAGDPATAAGTDALACGPRVNANGTNAVAVGSDTSATGDETVAIGTRTGTGAVGRHGLSLNDDQIFKSLRI